MSKLDQYIRAISKNLSNQKGMVYLAMEVAVAVTLLGIIILIIKILL